MIKIKFNVAFLVISLFFSSALFSDNKRFIIDICSYNNAEWYRENLESVFRQDYDNYHIIYTDDVSTDGTADLVEDYARQQGFEDKITIIRNKKRRRQLANHWRVVQLCEPNDVIVVLDGDDWLAHEKVFSMVNRLYTDQQAWITYGQYKNWPTMQFGYCQRTPLHTIKTSSYRKFCWYWGHLRTYYAWLAQQVKLEDLLLDELKDEKALWKAYGPRVGYGTLTKMKEFHGKFFPASADLTLGYPMLEMAGDHLKFVSSVVYMRNIKTNLNTYKTQSVQQQYSARYVRTKNKYSAITGDTARFKERKKATDQNMAVFFHKDSATLETFINSADKVFKNVKQVFIFYDKRATNLDDFSPFAEMAAKTTLIDISRDGLTQAVQKYVEEGHVFCVRGDEYFENSVDLAYCAEMLDRTFAYAFYASPARAVKALYEWTGLDDVYCWPFKTGDISEMHHPACLSMSLYRKHDLIDLFQRNKVRAIKDLDTLVSPVYSTNKIGLFFYQSL